MVLSPVAAEHVQRPRNAGALPGATHVGVGGTPGEGPYVRLYFLVEDDVIRKATYECNGCPSSTAAASVTAQILTGRTPEQALRLEPRDLLLILGGLPEGKESYATLATQAVRAALRSELSC